MSLLFLDGKEEFEFGRQFFFAVESIGEIYSSNSAVGMDLHSESFYVVGTVGPSSEVWQIELNLIPTYS